MKLSSITHCIKSSQHICNLTRFCYGSDSIHHRIRERHFFFRPRCHLGYFASKYDINAHLAALPFICMLSHERIVIGKSFSIRRLSPSATYQNTLRDWLKSTFISPFGNGERDDFYLLRCKFSDDRLTILFPPMPSSYKRTNQHTILFAGRAACRQLIYAVVFLEGVEQDPVRRHNHGSEYPQHLCDGSSSNRFV